LMASTMQRMNALLERLASGDITAQANVQEHDALLKRLQGLRKKAGAVN
jgi:hypothetical protein